MLAGALFEPLADRAHQREVEVVSLGGFLDQSRILRCQRELERWLEIRDAKGKLITVLELLSPSNKLDLEGRERYSVNLRYPRELRDSVEKLKRTLVSTPAGQLVPIGQMTDIHYTTGPPMVRDEDAQLVGYVFVDVVDRDLVGYVAEAKQTVNERIQLPPGVHLTWGGQFQYFERAKEKLKLVVPFTLLLVFVLLYLNTESVTKTVIVLLAVPFSLVGGVVAPGSWDGQRSLRALQTTLGSFFVVDGPEHADDAEHLLG